MILAASRAVRPVKKLHRCSSSSSIINTQQSSSSSSSSSQNERLLHDASSLLHREHDPLVRIGDSTVCPGRGVFCRNNVVAGTGMCLYPGIYTPPLPVIQIADGLSEDVLLADAGLEHNAYVLTLQAVGGQLDAEPVASTSTEDSNPSACGHLVNHPSPTTTGGANVDVFSFTWDDPTILLSSPQLDTDLMYPYYDIPNEARADGSPWYLDGSTGQIVYFPTSEAAATRGRRRRLGGAILFALCDLKEGDELFLDYKLRYPYPNWAKDWYIPCS